MASDAPSMHPAFTTQLSTNLVSLSPKIWLQDGQDYENKHQDTDQPSLL